jgi:Na+/melibiose symporter-like transporter
LTEKIKRPSWKFLFVVIALFIVISEMCLLVSIFPQTGLARILFIPFWIVVSPTFAFFVNRKNHEKSLNEILFLNLIFHILFFHLLLYSWPQSSAIKKNLVVEFYSINWNE